jgi:hypothetical protein
MRKEFYIFITALLLVSGMHLSMANTQTKLASTKTETIKVSGKCDMCKTRIEKAALIDGVSKATWDKKSQLLTLVYNPSKVKSDDVQKKIAAVGHDTEKYKADDKVYKALPGCCQYR